MFSVECPPGSIRAPEAVTSDPWEGKACECEVMSLSSQRSEFLVCKEGFGLTAGGVDTEWTAEGELTGTRLIRLQMRLNQISQRLWDRQRDVYSSNNPRMHCCRYKYPRRCYGWSGGWRENTSYMCMKNVTNSYLCSYPEKQRISIQRFCPPDVLHTTLKHTHNSLQQIHVSEEHSIPNTKRAIKKTHY